MIWTGFDVQRARHAVIIQNCHEENTNQRSTYVVMSLLVRSRRVSVLSTVISSGSVLILLSRRSRSEMALKLPSCPVSNFSIWLLPTYNSYKHTQTHTHPMRPCMVRENINSDDTTEGKQQHFEKLPDLRRAAHFHQLFLNFDSHQIWIQLIIFYPHE